jgi:hypothetical protein
VKGLKENAARTAKIISAQKDRLNRSRAASTKIRDLPLFSKSENPVLRAVIHGRMTAQQMERYHSDPNFKAAKRAAQERYRAKPASKIKAKDCTKKWQRDNRAKVRAWKREQLQLKPWLRIRKTLRKRISDMLNGHQGGSKTIGCSAENLKAHLEQQFKAGMSWENYGTEWHVDHIIPLAAAEHIEQLERLNHFSNLQPLWAAENLAKGAKLDWTPPKGTSEGGGGEGAQKLAGDL